MSIGHKNIKIVNIVTPTGDNVVDDTNDAVRVNIVAGAGAGGTSSTDEATYTPTSSAGTPVMGARDDTSPDTLAEDKVGIIRATEYRALHVNLRDAAGAEVAVGGGTQYDEDTASTAGEKVTMAGVVRRDTPSSLVGTDGDRTELIVDANGRLHVITPLPAGAATEAKQDTLIGHVDGLEGLTGATNETAPATDTAASGLNGRLQRIAQRLTSLIALLPAAFTSGGGVKAGLVDALPAGTNNIGDVDVLTLPGVAGDIAHDAADAGNPLKVGAKAIAHGASPTAVAAGDRTDLFANRHGVLFVMPGHPNAQTFRTNWTSAQTDVALITCSAGQKFVLTQLDVTCDKDNAAATAVRAGAGAANTPTGAGVVLAHSGVAPGSGISKGNGGGILLVGGDGEDLRLTAEACSVGADVVGTYYLIES